MVQLSCIDHGCIRFATRLVLVCNHGPCGNISRAWSAGAMLTWWHVHCSFRSVCHTIEVSVSTLMGMLSAIKQRFPRRLLP